MKEIVAIEAFGAPYMTQSAADLPITERGYWSKIAGVKLTTKGLRGATAEEREQWLQEIEKLNPENV